MSRVRRRPDAVAVRTAKRNGPTHAVTSFFGTARNQPLRRRALVAARSRSTSRRSRRYGRTEETQKLERAVLGAPAEDLDLVFANIDGRPLDPRGISQALQVRRKRTGLPHIRLHDLRHGAATLAIEGDVNLELIRRRLGHAAISTTINLYARHEIETAERDSANTVAALLQG